MIDIHIDDSNPDFDLPEPVRGTVIRVVEPDGSVSAVIMHPDDYAERRDLARLMDTLDRPER